MYMIYVLSGDKFSIEQLLPETINNTSVTIKPEWQIEENPVSVFIFAYDRNLREYYTTSNTFFKPNAYRLSFSTVNGGFGTFGAVSSAVINL